MLSWVQYHFLLSLAVPVLAYFYYQTYNENVSLRETIMKIARKQEEEISLRETVNNMAANQEQQNGVIVNLESKLLDCSNIRLLNGLMDESRTTKRSTEDLTLKTKLLIVDVDAVKKSVTDMDSRVRHVDNKLKALALEDEALRRKVKDFQDEVDHIRRSQRDSNPIFDAISRLFSWITQGPRLLLT